MSALYALATVLCLAIMWSPRIIEAWRGSNDDHA